MHDGVYFGGIPSLPYKRENLVNYFLLLVCATY